MRGSTFRDTEWLRWNGTALRPARGEDVLRTVELYNHTGALAASASEFDAFENANSRPPPMPRCFQRSTRS